MPEGAALAPEGSTEGNTLTPEEAAVGNVLAPETPEETVVGKALAPEETAVGNALAPEETAVENVLVPEAVGSALAEIVGELPLSLPPVRPIDCMSRGFVSRPGGSDIRSVEVSDPESPKLSLRS